MNKIAAFGIVVALSLCGCSQTRWAKIEVAKQEQRDISAANMQLRAAGLEREYGAYSRSEFAKHNDVVGYIGYSNEQRRQQDEISTQLYKAAIPSLSLEVRKCVSDSRTGDYYRKDPNTCFSQLTDAQKAPLVDKRLGIIPDYRKMEVIGPIGQELKAAHDEKASQEWTDIVMRLRARDQRKAAAQKAAAKQAYDNSIQSLIE